VELGKTPYVLQFRVPTQLSLELPGYEPQRLTVTPDTEPNVAIELPPRAAPVRGHETAALSRERPATMPPSDAPPAVMPAQADAPTMAASELQSLAADKRVRSALLAESGRARRAALLESGAPYATFASARHARESGALDAACYRDVVWVLRTQRNRRIDAEKQSYRRDLIKRAEYERRVHQIELDYAGK
jgi:hypothetical protein